MRLLFTRLSCYHYCLMSHTRRSYISTAFSVSSFAGKWIDRDLEHSMADAIRSVHLLAPPV